MLSPKQERIFNFIRRYSESNKETPTISEIGQQFQMRSPASVHKNLTALEREGLITKVPNVARGIRLSDLALNRRRHGKDLSAARR